MSSNHVWKCDLSTCGREEPGPITTVPLGWFQVEKDGHYQRDFHSIECLFRWAEAEWYAEREEAS